VTHPSVNLYAEKGYSLDLDMLKGGLWDPEVGRVAISQRQSVSPETQ